MADTAGAGTARELAGRRVLVVSNEQVAARMAGPAIRALHLAQQLAARGAHVTLAMPRTGDADPGLLDGVSVTTFGTPSMRRFRTLAAQHDVVVTQPQRADVAWGLHRSGAAVIYDLYVPSFVERIAQLGTEPGDARLHERLLQRDHCEYATALELGDAFICATERQRDHWLGALGQAGRLDLDLLERDPRADRLMGVVPFGVPDAAPPPLEGRGALRGDLVPSDSIVLLWTGGLWNWFDPVTVVEGLARAREHEPRLRLVVMGVKHPEAHWHEQHAGRVMRERARELGLLDDGSVVLCDQWIPYDQRHRFLLDADIAVSAHRDTLETRLSFRTRFLDHLWAGLPTLTSPGGDLVDRMVESGAARTVAGDAEAWSNELVSLASDADALTSMSQAARTLAATYSWTRTTAPLASIAGSIAPNANSPKRARLTRLVRYCGLLVRIRIQAKGFRSMGEAVRNATGS